MILEAGLFADIVVFNPDAVLDKGTLADPVQYPEGIEHVFINGQAVVDRGVFCPTAVGTVLRKNGMA